MPSRIIGLTPLKADLHFTLRSEVSNGMRILRLARDQFNGNASQKQVASQNDPHDPFHLTGDEIYALGAAGSALRTSYALDSLSHHSHPIESDSMWIALAQDCDSYIEDWEVLMHCVAVDLDIPQTIDSDHDWPSFENLAVVHWLVANQLKMMKRRIADRHN